MEQQEEAIDDVRIPFMAPTVDKAPSPQALASSEASAGGQSIGDLIEDANNGDANGNTINECFCGPHLSLAEGPRPPPSR